MKILNLYCGIGGNRRLWDNTHSITAVELNPKIARVYKDHFSQDTVIVTDAHAYLLKNFAKFDFIWASPPCQSHSRLRHNFRYRAKDVEYPDMRLYQEILFLKHHFKGKWVIENVRPYYQPLIRPTLYCKRHLFWSNFEIAHRAFIHTNVTTLRTRELEALHGFDLSGYKLPYKRQILRNCVVAELGEHLLDNAIWEMMI